MVRKQGAWGVWWLSMLTIAIYYFIWYGRINREICAVLGVEVPADGQAWSQIVPIFSIIGLANTANRLNQALEKAGSTERVNAVTACLLAPIWFASQTRYLQRRVNTLADALGAPASTPAAAPAA